MIELELPSFPNRFFFPTKSSVFAGLQLGLFPFFNGQNIQYRKGCLKIMG